MATCFQTLDINGGTSVKVYLNRLTFLVVNSFISGYFFKKFGTNFQKLKAYIGTEDFSS